MPGGTNCAVRLAHALLWSDVLRWARCCATSITLNWNEATIHDKDGRCSTTTVQKDNVVALQFVLLCGWGHALQTCDEACQFGPSQWKELALFEMLFSAEG